MSPVRFISPEYLFDEEQMDAYHKISANIVWAITRIYELENSEDGCISPHSSQFIDEIWKYSRILRKGGLLDWTLEECGLTPEIVNQIEVRGEISLNKLRVKRAREGRFMNIVIHEIVQKIRKFLRIYGFKPEIIDTTPEELDYLELKSLKAHIEAITQDPLDPLNPQRIEGNTELLRYQKRCDLLAQKVKD
jgi:hypothetical protein